MTDLNRTLLDLFRSSDGLLLPDQSVIEEISKKQHELKVWNEEIVLQGLITMKELLQELAKIVGYAQAAVEPKYLFAAPAYAIPKLLKKINWSLKDVDLIELNEAFAAQVLADGYALADQGWDWNKVNVNGGAIALGHPLGASGARVLTTLLYALKDRGLKRGIASLCLGGGEAVAMAVEME